MRMANPGVWSIHCHILAHMISGKSRSLAGSRSDGVSADLVCVSAGMQSVWVVGHADQIVTIPMDMGAGYFFYGGDAYGNATHSPNVYHFFDDTDSGNLCDPVVAGGGDELVA